tara:strand:+ start:723 stop:1001 length:279 start_codon:yes stop_codon:yes gene_type:complete
MINTDKYEGHIRGPWRDLRHEGAMSHHIVTGNVNICTVFPNEATANLVTDAPLLLEEVKRLREGILNIRDTVEDNDLDWMCIVLKKITELIE